MAIPFFRRIRSSVHQPGRQLRFLKTMTGNQRKHNLSPTCNAARTKPWIDPASQGKTIYLHESAAVVVQTIYYVPDGADLHFYLSPTATIRTSYNGKAFCARKGFQLPTQPFFWLRRYAEEKIFSARMTPVLLCGIDPRCVVCEFGARPITCTALQTRKLLELTNDPFQLLFWKHQAQPEIRVILHHWRGWRHVNR